MAKKIDRLFDYFSLLLIAIGGMTLHILTALTIKSYYGDPWGYVSFFLPGISEIYMASVQLGDNMYNYIILLASFITLTLAVGIIKLVRNIIRSRIDSVVGESA